MIHPLKQSFKYSISENYLRMNKGSCKIVTTGREGARNPRQMAPITQDLNLNRCQPEHRERYIKYQTKQEK